jgi:hypothetical protein
MHQRGNAKAFFAAETAGAMAGGMVFAIHILSPLQSKFQFTAWREYLKSFWTYQTAFIALLANEGCFSCAPGAIIF